MLNCEVCGHEVAENAKACPNCGADIKQQLRKDPAINLLVKQRIIADVCFIVIIGVCLITSGILGLVSIFPAYAEWQWTIAAISGGFFAVGLVCGIPFLIWEIKVNKKLKERGYL